MKKLVSLGEILMRLSCEKDQRFAKVQNFHASYGGSEANVLITASNFGLSTEFLSILPENDLGKAALKELKINDVGVSLVKFQGNRMGIYFLESGAINRPGKVIYDRAHSSFSEIKMQWFNWEVIFKDCNWFHWSGITPAVSKNASEVCLDAVKTARRMGVTISADLNFRGNLWNYEGSAPTKTMRELVSHSDILLAGGYACDQFFGIKNVKNNIDLSKKIINEFPKLQKVAITNRKEINASHHKWSADLFSDGKLFSSVEYDIYPIVDRIGTGDSFMGALIFGLQNYDDEKALEFATAASCLKHSIPGDFNQVTKEEVLNLMLGEGSGRIKR